MVVIGVIIGLGLITALALGWFKGDESSSDGPQKWYSQLTGLEVSREEAERPVLGVMFNNSAEARPQTGLDSAGIVFETVTEGGITRYLALYQEDLPETVGPVRSLRGHFLDWAMGFEASIAHVGGSADSLATAENRDARSLNQFNHPEPYYRTNDRPAPHNMYARVVELVSLQDELNHSRSQFDEIPRSDDAPTDNVQAQSVVIDFSGPAYRAEFRYDPSTNSYIRYLAGEPHIDALTNEPIAVKNVIVIRSPASSTPVSAIGSGTALLFKDGNVREVRWEKPSFEQRLKLMDEENDEVALNRGSSWFAVLPEGQPVNY